MRQSRILAALSFGTDRVTILLNVVGALIVLGISVVMNVDAIGRSFFNAPFLGTVEVVEFSMVLIVFLQLPDVVRVGRMTRSGGFLGLLATRSPETARTLYRIIDTVAAVLMFIIFYATIPDLISAYEEGHFFGTPGLFTLIEWPVKLAIVVGCFLCGLRWALYAIVPPPMHDPTVEDLETEFGS
jgi:TRAP-type mannitol/chloroaromatic compound transport system permease small subunit